MSRFARIAGVIAGASLLAGCLVSDDPLFDETNATATPLAAGAYDACSVPADGDDDCNVVTVTKEESGRYLLSVADEDDVIEARFIDMGGGDYAAQLDDGDGEGYQYYWAHGTGDNFDFVMMWCADLPRALVDGLVASGGIEADEDYSTCAVRTADAVLAAAKAYAGGEATGDSVLRMIPAAP